VYFPSQLIVRAAAIDYLQQNSELAFQNIAITYFYLKHDEGEKSPEKIAMILLRNLVSKASTIPRLLCKMYEDDKIGTPPKFNDIVDLMISYFQYYTSIFVFFDGLDEGTQDQKQDVLDLIARVSRAGMRVFLTSQPHLELYVKELGTVVPYEIKAQERDLNPYIQERLVKARFDKRFPHFPVEDKERIRTKLVNDADGMYIQTRSV